MKYSRCDEFSPRVPRPASSPPPAGGGLSFAGLQAALHPRSILPSPRHIAPRSRLGNLARLGRSGGRHRFRQASSPPVQARRFAATLQVSPPPSNVSSKLFAISIGVNRPGFVPRRTGSRLCCSQIQQSAKRSSHRPRSVGQRSLRLRRQQLSFFV